MYEEPYESNLPPAQQPDGPLRDQTPRFAPLELPHKLTFSAIFSLAHRVYSLRFGLIVGAVTVALLIQFLVGFTAGLIDLGIFALIGLSQIPVQPITILVQAAIGTPLAVGPMFIAARIYRGERTGFGDMWIGFARWMPVAAVGLIVQLITLAITLPLTISMITIGGWTSTNPLGIAAVATLAMLSGVLSLFIAVRLYFAALLCADPAGPSLSITDSVKTSWRITGTCIYPLCGAAIVLSIIGFFTMILILVPFFLYGGPIIAAAGGVAYCIACHHAGVIPLAPYDDCPICGYDLRDSEGATCPECGSNVPRNLNDVPDLYESSPDNADDF